MRKKVRPALMLGHRLRPETFWLDGDMVDGFQCGFCCRSFPTIEEVKEFGECDVWVHEESVHPFVYHGVTFGGRVRGCKLCGKCPSSHAAGS